MKIIIKKSETADTRSCDFSKVSMEQLIRSSEQHIEDVCKGLELFRQLLSNIAEVHDYDKLSHIEEFHRDFINGFATTTWWDNHRRLSRHHLLADDGVPKDVNLLDVIEMITDCVMAGKARTGSVYPLEIKPEVLQAAFDNTVTLLKNAVEVQKEEEVNYATSN